MVIVCVNTLHSTTKQEMSSSSVARQKGNELLKSAAVGVAPVIRLERYQKALTHYHKALNSATNDRERSSAYKNIVVATHYITMLLFERNEIDQCLFFFKECLTHGNKAISTGRIIMPEDWIDNIEERLNSVFSDIFDSILSMRQDQRIRILQRFAFVPESKEQRVKMLKQLVIDYFHASVMALEKSDYKASLTALTEVYTPLTKLEQLATDSSDDILLQDFVMNMKEDVFKNRCISDSMQKRFMADQLLNSTINDAEDLDVTAIWQVIDFYSESIVLTRENDVEQEAISLSKLGILYHKVLLQKGRAKEYLMKVLQLAHSLQPRNLSEEKWFRDASEIISEYQTEEKRKEEKEWEKSRKKYLVSLKSKLDILKHNMTRLSIQKMLVWLYTEHPPKHVGAHKFNVNVKEISDAPGDALKKLLAKAIVYYHPDKINVEDHGMEYKVWCEEIVKNLTGKYEMMKGC